MHSTAKFYRSFNQALVAFTLSASVGASPASAQIYDAAKDFSTAHNPNGAWRYGSAAGLNSPFILSANRVSHPGTPIVGWSSSDETPGYPFTLTAAFKFQWGTSVFAPGWLSLHPESFGSYNVVNWIAPATGVYHVTSVFDSFNSLASDRPATVDLHLRLNQSDLWIDALGDSKDSTKVFHTVKLNAGDHLDFMVGSGASSDFDTVGFQATLTFVPVPEPATFGFFGASALGLYVFLRRRRARVGG
jgi:hypothetical protein